MLIVPRILPDISMAIFLMIMWEVVINFLLWKLRLKMLEGLVLLQ